MSDTVAGLLQIGSLLLVLGLLLNALLPIRLPWA